MNTITCVVRADLLLYSIIINLIMLVYMSRKDARSNYSSLLFKYILISIVFTTASETVSWFTGEIGNDAQIPIHYWSNFFFLASTALPAAYGLRYLDYKIFGCESRNRKWFYFFLIPTYLSVGLAVYNHFNRGILFYIADTNQYYRGPGLYFLLGFTYVFLFVMLAYFYRFRNMITGRITQAIILFTMAPVIGAFMQTMAYGTTFTMPSYTLAVFLTFLLLEKDEMLRDPLTHLYTRSNLENRLRFKLKSTDAFSVVLMDLNDFKWINDTYGHSEGDRVLQKVAEILSQSTNIEDMVCRYGGDEFFLLVEFKENIEDKLIGRIDSRLEKYNKSNSKYSVHLSYGYVYVENPQSITYDDLIHTADRKMYDDKHQRKSGKLESAYETAMK